MRPARRINTDDTLQSLFHSFAHGFNNTRWAASSISFATTTILTVAALILALRDGRGKRSFFSWSSETEPSAQKSWLVPGLQNLGNNCFLNVILQALASCSCFRSSLQKIVEEFEASSEEKRNGDMPLAISLNALLQELCMIRHEREVLSPRKVMLAMALYTPNFNLTNQQDAEEALAYMLSSLRKESSVCYSPNHCSLAVATAMDSRILSPKRRVIENELQRWTQSFLGPFNGIVGSVLTCQSCSFQISLDFQFFNCLYLSPPMYGGGSIVPGCSLEDCLKQFFVAEWLENYFCTHCWHTAALKYLSLLNKNETDIEKLQNCSKQETCDCKNIPSLGALPWSNSYSRTFKQLHIARSPKILCLNLQRASVNVFGDLLKLQGHISFPLTFNMSPFLNNGVEIRHCGQQIEPSLLHVRYSNLLKVSTNTYPLNGGIYKQGMKSNLTDTYISEKSEGIQAVSCSQVGETYRLVSVVEHFGSMGSGGHYTVYRRIDDSCCGWVGVSDSHVYSVCEEEVVGARASLLFYQRVLDET